MIKCSENIHKEMLLKYSKNVANALAIDGGTIEKRHFFDIILLSPGSGLNPYIYDSIESDFMNVDFFKIKVKGTIEELKKNKM